MSRGIRRPAARWRTSAILAAGTLATGLLAGCTPTASERPLVAVTTNILGDVVGEIVGDEADVVVLMPTGADPHSFEISARTAARLRNADLLIANGLGLEEGLASHVEAAQADGVPVFVAGDHLDVLEYAEGDAAGQQDAHFWTDPGRMTDVVSALGPELAAIPGVDADAVTAGADAYVGELRQLDAAMTEAFAAIPPARRAIVTNHHVFGYLADRFDFRVIGAVIPSGSTLAAPSASDLRELTAAIEAAGVDTIFAESSSPDRLAQALAGEVDHDVRVVELVTESLTDAHGDAPTYLDLMRVNTERISTGLSS